VLTVELHWVRGKKSGKELKGMDAIEGNYLC
jgi:hypothetical protein